MDETNRAHRHLAERAGMNLTDLMALYYLYGEDGQATPSALSRHLGMTTGAVAILLNRLEERHFVRRHKHPSDGRAVLLKLDLEETKRAFEAAGRQPHQIEDGLLDDYSDAEMAVIARFLGTVLERLKARNAEIRLLAR
jgi:DNA-binding MarR family transcriptional regulator